MYTVAPWAWVVGGLGITIVYTNGRIGPLRTVFGRLCTLLRRGLGCGWPWDHNSVHRSPKMASRGRFGAFVYTVASREVPRGDAGGRNSVHRSPKMASRRRFGAFVYTVTTRVAIRIASRSAQGGTSASATMACRRRLLAGPSCLVGKTGSARAAPLPGWHLRRGVNPHKPPKSLISCSVLGGKMLLTGSPA